MKSDERKKQSVDRWESSIKLWASGLLRWCVYVCGCVHACVFMLVHASVRHNVYVFVHVTVCGYVYTLRIFSGVCFSPSSPGLVFPPLSSEREAHR